MSAFSDSPYFAYLVLPLLIFLARVLDVSLGTIRILLISRGQKLIVPLLGFIEIFIWLLAIRQVMTNLSNIYCYIGFAGGFAVGNYVGMLIEEKIALGLQIIRVITSKDASEMIAYLRSKGYGVTSLDAQGASGHVNVLFMMIRRANTAEVIKIIQEYHPKSFYTIEDVRLASAGVLPVVARGQGSVFLNRKGK